MNFANVLSVYKKELRDTTRDKRTLYAMIVMPVLVMPLLLWGISKFSDYQQQQNQTKTVTIAILSSQKSEQLIKAIALQKNIHLVTNYSDIPQAVKQDKVDAGLVLPDKADQLMIQNNSVKAMLYQKSVKDVSSQALVRLSTVVQAYNIELVHARLAQQGTNPNILNGITLSTEDLSTTQEKSGFGLSFILPLFIVMWAITGGQYTAIDASAGERERKTLEALLLTPASRLDIVTGKFLAIATVSLTSVVLSIVSLYFALGNIIHTFSGQANSTGSAFSQLNLASSLTPQAVVLMVGMSVLLALLFAAILLTVGIFAKSFREAQSYMAPAYLITIIPVSILNSVPNLQVPSWVYLIPPVNAVMLFKEVLKGTYDPFHIGYTICTLILASVIAIFVATKIFQQESVLFKT
jgi:sodium transport system permease protein